MNPDDDTPKPPAAPSALDAIRALVQKIRARPRHATLDLATLRALPPDDLDATVCDYVQDRLDGRNGRRVPLAALPRGLQVHYLSVVVEGEVLNGGFNQFFWNPSSRHAALVPAALRELGAEEAATLFEQAWVVAISESAMRTKLQAERTLEAFSRSYEQTRLGQFDDAFYPLAEAFAGLRTAYLATHGESFVA